MADARARGDPPVEPRSWSTEYARLSVADREGSLAAEDLERLALCAYMLGRDDESASAWMRAHRQHLR